MDERFRFINSNNYVDEENEIEEDYVDIFNDRKFKNKKNKSNSENSCSSLMKVGKELVETKQIFNEIITELQAIHTDLSPDILKAVKKEYSKEKSRIVQKIIREIVNNLMN